MVAELRAGVLLGMALVFFVMIVSLFSGRWISGAALAVALFL